MAVITQMSRAPSWATGWLAWFGIPVARIGITDGTLPKLPLLTEIVQFGGKDDGLSQIIGQVQRLDDLLDTLDDIMRMMLP